MSNKPKKFRKPVIRNLNIQEAKCFSCEHFYAVREIQHGITPLAGSGSKSLLCNGYCMHHKTCLPVIMNKDNIPVPNVKDCLDFQIHIYKKNQEKE